MRVYVCMYVYIHIYIYIYICIRIHLVCYVRLYAVMLCYTVIHSVHHIVSARPRQGCRRADEVVPPGQESPQGHGDNIAIMIMLMLLLLLLIIIIMIIMTIIKHNDHILIYISMMYSKRNNVITCHIIYYYITLFGTTQTTPTPTPTPKVDKGSLNVLVCSVVIQLGTLNVEHV